VVRAADRAPQEPLERTAAAPGEIGVLRQRFELRLARREQTAHRLGGARQRCGVAALDAVAQLAVDRVDGHGTHQGRARQHRDRGEQEDPASQAATRLPGKAVLRIGHG
jgi:hypothetical protein